MEKNTNLFERIYEWLMGEPPIKKPQLKVVLKKKKNKNGKAKNK